MQLIELINCRNLIVSIHYYLQTVWEKCFGYHSYHILLCMLTIARHKKNSMQWIEITYCISYIWTCSNSSATKNRLFIIILQSISSVYTISIWYILHCTCNMTEVITGTLLHANSLGETFWLSWLSYAFLQGNYCKTQGEFKAMNRITYCIRYI
jgi:hypothetical protein